MNNDQESLLNELNLRASIIAHRRYQRGMATQALRDEVELLEITRALDEHPDGYEGPCQCRMCLSYD